MSDIAEETKNTVTTEEDMKHSGNEQTYASIAAGEEHSKKTGEDQGARKNGEASGEPAKVTKIPVTGGDDFKGEDSKQPTQKGDYSIPVTIHRDEPVNIPVTLHTEEKQKKPRQPTKKERAESIKQTANKEFAGKRYAAAIQLYNEALGLDPTNHLLYSNRAAARYNLGQEIASQAEHPDAKDHCAIHGEASPSWNAAMSLYYGGLEDALKAIEIEPNFLKAYLRVGACLIALGKYQAAVQTYEATLTRFPNEESVKTALKEAKEKSAKLEEGFPLYHSFINLAGQPKVPETPAAQSPPNKAASARASGQAASARAQAAAQESAARLHRELFGKRNALVQTPKPETRWQFYFEQPPNPRSAASWEPDTRTRNRGEEDEDDGSYYYQEEEDEQQYRPHAHFQPQYQQSQFKPQPPRFQRTSSQQQSQFHQPQPQYQQQPHFHSHQPSYQSPYQQSSYQQPSYQQPSYQQSSNQQPFPQHTHYQQPLSQSHSQPNRKRSDHTTIPNRKATNGYLQELCENLRVSQYLPALLDQGVETVDDLLLLPPEAIRSIFPTLGHQARVLDWLKKAKGEL